MKNLFLYFILAYAISWIIWFPLYAPVFGISGLPVLPYHHAFGGWGPMLAAFIMTIIEKGSTAPLLKSMFNQGRSILLLITGFFLPIVLLLLALVINTMINHVPFKITGLGKTTEFPEFPEGIYFLYNLIFFGLGEETGWRGYALPRLQQKYNALLSSTLLTIGWAAWHIPAFFYRPSYAAMDMAGIGGWLFSMFLGSIITTWLFNSSKGSILACAVFHAAMDMVFISDATDNNTMGYLGMLVTLLGIAILIVFKPQNLSRQNKVSNLG
jgi:membrane protease YdiL (CAAX protease family)